jgi:diaminopimelate epimerase
VIIIKSISNENDKIAKIARILAMETNTTQVKPFLKYSGSGNDFILFDLMELSQEVDFYIKWLTKQKIVELCHRRQGVGADGIVLLIPAKQMPLDFEMIIFNSDGSEAEMCGNATRCCTHYFAVYKKTTQKEFQFKTKNGLYRSWYLGNNVARVQMTELYDVDKFNLTPLIYNKGSCYLNTGVPHSVFHLPTLENFDFIQIARDIRYNSQFAPNGTNVDFFQVLGEKKIKLKVYERGVEDETLCCGTGVIACAYTCFKLYGWEGLIEVETLGGIIKAMINPQENFYAIEGSVELVYRGII